MARSGIAQSSKPRKPPKGIPVIPMELKTKFPGVKFISRGPASYLLGISGNELRRREQDGVYQYVLDEEGRAWYDEAYIARIASEDRAVLFRQARGEQLLRETKKMDAGQAVRYSPEAAAMIFRELKAGKTLDQIIIEHAVHPEQAIAIHDAYARVCSAVYLSPEDLHKLSHLPLRAWPPKNASQFVEAIRFAMESDLKKCAKCQTAYARICGACVDKKSARANGTNTAHASEDVSDVAADDSR